MGERFLIEHPTVFGVTALNSKFNKDAKPMIVHSGQKEERTLFMVTNDGVLAQLRVNVDSV